VATYTQIISGVEALFASSDWTNNNVKAFPADYNGNRDLPEFVTISVLLSNSEKQYGGGKGATEGMFYLEIYTASGQGQRRPFEIADMLDSLLEMKTLLGAVETQTSTVGNPATDTANDSLSRTEYLVPFKTY
jgi:hypothetical protein